MNVNNKNLNSTTSTVVKRKTEQYGQENEWREDFHLERKKTF